MLKEAIEKILDLAPVQYKEAEGILYANRPMLKIRPPIPIPVHLATLQGLVDLYSAEFEERNDLMFHIASPTEVHLISAIQKPHNNRLTLAVAEIEIPRFLFDHWMPIEDFIIWISQRFDASDQREALIRFVGNIRDEKVNTVVDDGITQQVTARTGVARVENATIGPFVDLAPNRTFPDVEQVKLRFLFRMRTGREGELPTCALFEVDGSGWENVATERIAARLRDLLDDEDKIPILR